MDIDAFQHADDMKYVAQYVLENELVNGATEGIARAICSKGWHSLSPKQKEVFQKNAVPLATLQCDRCGAEIPYSELEFNDSNLCGWCLHQMEKIEKE